MQDLLDCFSVCTAQLDLANHALARVKRGVQAQAEVVASSTAKTKEGAAKILPNVVDNLTHVGTIPESVVALLKLMAHRQPTWKHTNNADKPPMIKDSKIHELTARPQDVDIIRHLAFSTFPLDIVMGSRIKMLQDALFQNKASKLERPVALITVGPPGSGKSFLSERCLRDLAEREGKAAGFTVDDFVHIDPDYWITELCSNNNAYRPLANFQNQNTFMRSMRQRTCILFDGTGKDPVNTCGRIISRLKQANFRIYIAVVLASYDTCLQRIATRAQETGRNVPTFFVTDAFRGLQKSVPFYLDQNAKLADEIYIYNNSGQGGADPAWTVKKDDPRDSVESVIHQVSKLLWVESTSLLKSFAVDTLKKVTESEGKLTPAVVVLTGSFNPIHSGHIQTLKAAKEHLEQSKNSNYVVVAAVLQPSPDARLEKKFKEKFDDESQQSVHRLIAYNQRIELCQLAAMQEKGMCTLPAVEAAGICMEAKDAPGTVCAVTNKIRDHLAEWLKQEAWAGQAPQLEAFQVAGADNLEEWIRRHGTWAGVEAWEHAQANRKFPHKLIMARPGHHMPDEDAPDGWFSVDEVSSTNHVSSTECREMIADSDWSGLGECLGKDVCERVRALSQRDALYKPITSEANSCSVTPVMQEAPRATAIPQRTRLSADKQAKAKAKVRYLLDASLADESLEQRVADAANGEKEEALRRAKANVRCMLAEALSTSSLEGKVRQARQRPASTGGRKG